MRYLGLIATVQVWRSGYCYRLPFLQFLCRYKMICGNTWPRWRGSPIEGASLLLRSLPIPSAEFTFGRTKLFVRSPRTVFELEDFRRVRLHDLALLIQKIWRGYRQKKRYQRIRHSQMVIASAWRSWRVSVSITRMCFKHFLYNSLKNIRFIYLYFVSFQFLIVFNNKMKYKIVKFPESGDVFPESSDLCE